MKKKHGSVEEINFLISLEKMQSYFYNQINKSIESNSLIENTHFNDKLINEEDELKNTLEKIKSIVSGHKNSIPHISSKETRQDLNLRNPNLLKRIKIVQVTCCTLLQKVLKYECAKSS